MRQSKSYIKYRIFPVDWPHIVVQIATLLIKHHWWQVLNFTAVLFREVRSIFDYFIQHFALKLAVFTMRILNVVPRVCILCKILLMAKILKKPEKLIILLEQNRSLVVNALNKSCFQQNFA